MHSLNTIPGMVEVDPNELDSVNGLLGDLEGLRRPVPKALRGLSKGGDPVYQTLAQATHFGKTF